MNERERWIVYPLLFFALGASLRDKFLQHISTRDLECKQQLVAKQIVCEELSVLDPGKDNRIVAKLTSGAPTGAQATQNPDRFGVLLLFDSEGKELCGVTNQALSVREINCLTLKVVDPDNPARALAALASAAVPPAQQGGRPRRFGVLALNNQEYGRLVGVPPANSAVSPPEENESDSDDPEGSAEEPPGDAEPAGDASAADADEA